MLCIHVCAGYNSRRESVLGLEVGVGKGGCMYGCGRVTLRSVGRGACFYYEIQCGVVCWAV